MYPIFDSLSSDLQNLLLKELELVIEKNKFINLTRIDSIEDGLLLHVEDSLSALPEFSQAPEGRYADLGSGGGFPAMPLAIVNKRETLLIDARMNKMQAMQDIINQLCLNDYISTYSGRAELLARTERAGFSVITARALAKVSVLLELSSPLLKLNGHLICYKAQIEEDEIQNAERVSKLTGFKLISQRQFLLGNEYTRCVLVYKKVSEPSIRLPRQEGYAQKNPL